MTAIDQWRDRSEYTKIIQSLKRGDQKKKEVLNEVTKVTNEMIEFINRIGRQSITPEEDKQRQRLLIWNRVANGMYRFMKEEETEFLEVNMKRECDALLNNFGKLSNNEEQNICSVGNILLDRAMRLKKSRVSKSLRIGWIRQTN